MRLNAVDSIAKSNVNRQSFGTKNTYYVVMAEDEEPDIFEMQEEDDNEDYLAGPYGHPYTGRPIISSGTVKSIPKKSFLKSLIEKITMKNIDFNDDVAKFALKRMTENAELLTSTKKIVENGGFAIGDINGDGIIDKVMSAVNSKIDINGDGIPDLIGTLMDTTGDGIPDTILTSAGKIIKLAGKTAKVVQDAPFDINNASSVFVPFTEFLKSLR